ncbi:ATP-binding protein [Orbaceae bacterium ac157xtp]
MKRRLFWKILIVFWGIFYIAFQLTWVGFTFYLENRDKRAFYHIPTKVEMIAQLLHISGEQEAINFISHLPETERNYFSIIPLNEQENRLVVTSDIKRNLFIYQQKAVAPNKTVFLVEFKDQEKNYTEATIFNMPIPMFLMGLAGGLLFSLLLAWNLTRPMKLLRQGFNRVAQGDLSVRLYDKLKKRHDELSELAGDFDSMVEQLHILISDRQALLHDVSHELRTPLARLRLAIGLAQQNEQNIGNSLKRIELESERLDTLIGEILNYSRDDSVTNNLDEYFDLKELISIVVEDANYESTPDKISVNFIVGNIHHPIIKGNADKIRRALENIIRNAIRFSQPEQIVEVTLNEKGKFLQIEVLDHGPGVEECKLSSIFEPFVRIQSPQLGKGYGLGLAIARKIITMHEGTIQARNRDTGGLIMKIKLPYWKPID